MDILQMEKPLHELSNRISELRAISQQSSPSNAKGQKKNSLSAEIVELEKKFELLAKEIFANLSPYQITQLSRHPARPYTLDIIAQLSSDFIELHGDRNFMDDAAIVTGLGNFRGRRVVFIGHQKGRGTKENVKRNFGMPRPEGYRKALRVMSMAERFQLPIVTFIDTPGAYPGMDAEERGQSEAIAKNIMVMSRLSVPIISIVVGEGGSGGALAIGVANRVLMMGYSTYSVISPEGCASILWKEGSQADRAANVLGLTADVAFKNGVIDEIIEEPLGGAHWQSKKAIDAIGVAIEKHLSELSTMTKEQLRRDRIQKFFKIGATTQSEPLSPFRREKALVPEWEEDWEKVAAFLEQ